MENQKLKSKTKKDPFLAEIGQNRLKTIIISAQ
jgi:hypothetical protein